MTKQIAGITAGVLVSGMTALAQRGTEPPTQVVHKHNADLMSTVKAAIAATPELSLTEVKNTTDYLINIVHRGKPGNAITHVDYHESHYIMEGGGTLVTGGRLMQRDGMTIVEGGQSQVVRKGDAVVIPKNTPHWYSQIDGTLVYLENRFKAPQP